MTGHPTFLSRLDVSSAGTFSLSGGLYGMEASSDPANNLPLMALQAQLQGEAAQGGPAQRSLAGNPETVYHRSTSSAVEAPKAAPAPPMPPTAPGANSLYGGHSLPAPPGAATQLQSVLDRINQRSGAAGGAAGAPVRASGGPVPREALQLFVGNMVSDGSTVDLRDFLNLAMRQVGLNTTEEDPVISCRSNAKFSFIEFRHVDDCSACLNLNGIPFMGSLLKIDRPAKYAGPATPAKTWQELTGQAVPAGNFVGEVGVNPATKGFREIFIGNTPPDTTAAALSDFIGGALQRMGMARPEGTPCAASPIVQVRVNAKFSFVEFRSVEEASNTLNLNGIPFNGCALNIKRSAKHEPHLGPDPSVFFSWDDLLSRWMTGEVKLLTAGPPTAVLCITNMVGAEELADAELHADMIEDTTEECAMHGSVKSVSAPSGAEGGAGQSSGGRLFVEMQAEEDAKRVLVALKGRSFDGRVVDVKFYPQAAFHARRFQEPLENYIIASSGVVPLNSIFVAR